MDRTCKKHNRQQVQNQHSFNQCKPCQSYGSITHSNWPPRICSTDSTWSEKETAASSFKMKPNTYRFPVPGVNPTQRLHGRNNAAPGYKDWNQLPARVTENYSLKIMEQGGATRILLREQTRTEPPES